MENSSQFLFLASGVKNDQVYWFVGVKNSDEDILKDKNLLDCHRKELIGNESAKDILYAINLNLNNLFDEFEKSEYLIYKPTLGISLNIPLNVLENIFDFWLNIYREKVAWETCLGLLKIRKKVSLLNLIRTDSLKGNSKKWAIEIEKLHSFRQNSVKNALFNEPMWQ